MLPDGRPFHLTPRRRRSALVGTVCLAPAAPGQMGQPVPGDRPPSHAPPRRWELRCLLSSPANRGANPLLSLSQRHESPKTPCPIITPLILLSETGYTSPTEYFRKKKPKKNPASALRRGWRAQRHRHPHARPDASPPPPAPTDGSVTGALFPGSTVWRHSCELAHGEAPAHHPFLAREPQKYTRARLLLSNSGTRAPPAPAQPPGGSCKAGSPQPPAPPTVPTCPLLRSPPWGTPVPESVPRAQASGAIQLRSPQAGRE